MLKKPLGSSGISTSVIGMGTAAMDTADYYNNADTKKAIKTVHAALDQGIRLIDTAPSYGWGAAEKIVGKAISGRRDQVEIATKCGVWWKSRRGSPNGTKNGKDTYICLSPDAIEAQLEDSLRGLGVDYVDLLQVHKPSIPPDLTPIEETMDCLINLKRKGKIRAVGVSNMSLQQLQSYQSIANVDSNQLRYSMLYRDHESDVMPFCLSHNIATLTYWSLEYGLLSGKIPKDRNFAPGDFRNEAEHWHPWYKSHNREKLMSLFSGWHDLNEKYTCTISQLVLAWTAAQPTVSHVLCGSKTVDQSIENAAAGSLNIDSADIKRMEDDLIALDSPD